ncbi:hypothetical protein AAEX28_04165 [Lentisphaerota bacterium WC36G]|nr:hypothetical protein LJT99_07035 [Lentisphaerae bacterium WC36]
MGINGNFNWVRQIDECSINGDSDNKTITEAFIVHEQFMDKFKDYGTTYEPKNSFEERQGYGELYITKYKITWLPSNVYKVTYTYSEESEAAAQAQKQDGASIYSLDTATIERPLEAHPNYKCLWTNNLYLAVKLNDVFTPSLPSNYDSATQLSDVKFPYCFAKETPADKVVNGIAYTFYLVADKTKKQAENYLIPTNIINEKIYYKNESRANNAAKTVGKLQAPKITYGLPKDDKKYLIMSATVEFDKETKKYVVSRNYQYGEEIDTDLYEVTNV